MHGTAFKDAGSQVHMDKPGSRLVVFQVALQTDTWDSSHGCRQSGAHGQARNQAGGIAGSIAD